MESNPDPHKLHDSVCKVVENANRLVDDAQYFLDFDRYASSYALCILAQEEYAKAFILHLVSTKALPWSTDIRRILRDHTCKQLIASIMDFLEPEDYFSWVENRAKVDYQLPATVVDAIHIFRYEKVSQNEDSDWIGDGEPPCDRTARKIADGLMDKEKQDALYVRLGKDGSVASTPSTITAEKANDCYQKTKRLGSVFWIENGMLVSSTCSIDYKQIAQTFRLLFGLCSLEEYNKGWWNQA